MFANQILMFASFAHKELEEILANGPPKAFRIKKNNLVFLSSALL
jgi:hypothetical protein